MIEYNLSRFEKRLNVILEDCTLVKQELRENCGFAVDIQYRMVINFIAMGMYDKIVPIMNHLMSKKELKSFHKEIIACTIKDLLYFYDDFDYYHDDSSISLDDIERDCLFLSGKIGTWLEQ